jgi:hypothetical protein
VQRLMGGEHLVRSPLLLMSMMLFILGFQSILMGLIAELLARTYHESQHKPTYTTRRVVRPLSPSASADAPAAAPQAPRAALEGAQGDVI